MQGKVRRLQLGAREKKQLLRMAHEDWREGRLPDRGKLIHHIDHRARGFAAAYLDGDFKEELLEFITEQEAKFSKASRQRLTLAGMLPVDTGDSHAEAGEVILDKSSTTGYRVGTASGYPTVK